MQEVEARFRARLLRGNDGRTEAVLFAGGRLLLFHSLAHMLITTGSLPCGYPAGSIR